MKKILLIVFSIIIIVIVSAITYVKSALPNVPLREEVKVDITQDRIAKGAYLANSVMVCMDCHSTRDWSKFSGPLLAGTEGKGGELFDQDLGFPGRYISKNITPYNLEDWTDAEIFRAITSGVNKDGNALFPVMPYHYYGNMDEEDIKDVIAYIRSLEPIEYIAEESRSDFPMNFIINTIPQEPVFTKKPNKEVSVDYGKYMTNAAGCIECHTPFDGKALELDRAFAGGREFKLPSGMLVTPNITPHKETGIGTWSKEAFVNRFKSYDMNNGYTPHEVGPDDYNTIMPWTMYASMDNTDLQAIYTYLMSVKPIENTVERFVGSPVVSRK